MNDTRIQDDLYEYVNGEWLATAVIPDDRPTTGGFANLALEVEEKMMKDFSSFARGEKTTDIEEMKDAIRLYKKVLDTDRRNKEGIAPVLPLLHKIRSITTVEELNRNLKELTLNGVDLPVDFGVEADMKDATVNSFVMTGPGIILPDTTYYGQPNGDRLLEVYAQMAEKILSYTDLSKEEQERYLKDTLTFDGLVAKEVKSQLEWADYVKNYNPTDIKEVCDCVSPLDLASLLKEIYGEKIPQTVIVYDPKAIREMKNYFNEENLSLYIHWAYVKTLLKKCGQLSEELYALSTTYRRTLMGVASDPTLEKRAYQVASGVYSEPVGIYYGRTYFGEEAKKDIVSLVRKIIETYKKRMAGNSFLKEETRQKAILKLSTITIKMGYPDESDEIYKEMKLDEESSYYEAIARISKIRILHNLNKLQKPVDKKEWAMPGHMVNACYDPSRNDITFPAAILQKPFYSIDQTVSENLGGIGAVIGHEISHAFDNNGAHFDENGNLSDWWSKEDFDAFDVLTKDMIAQWDGIEYAGGKVNGELVVSENIADNGGMGVTVQIMHETENTDFREYFTNWARVWCMKARPEYMELLLKSDVHSPAKLRCNIQVRNFDEWYETFAVSSQDEMFIPSEKRIRIW